MAVLPTYGPEAGSGVESASPSTGDGAGSAPYDAGRDAAAGDAAARARDQLWWAAGAVYRRRWWIVAVTALVAGAAVYLTLQIPNRYRAETRVLLPDSSSPLTALLGGTGGSAAAALLGGGRGGYTRYLAILTSRSTLEEVVDQFELIDHYDTSQEADPRAAALSELAERTSLDVNLEYNYLSMGVLDEDPRLAAQIANAYVGLLNARNTVLNQESAASYRVYLERRVAQAETELDSLMGSMQRLQERSGVIEPEAQGAALMESMSSAVASVAQAEVAYEVLRSELGDENPQTQAAAAGLSAARGQLAGLSEGSEAFMPVPLRRLPQVGRQYASLQQGILLQGEILQALYPLYEQALLSERRESDAVQVLDDAVPPTRKAEPRRSLIVIAATLSAFIVSVVLALALALWRAFGPSVAARLRAEGPGV